jgi:hypothetical protein
MAPMFQRNASPAAANDNQLPRRRVPERSLSSKYRKMPKMMAPPEWPMVLTSWVSWKVDNYFGLFSRLSRGRAVGGKKGADSFTVAFRISASNPASSSTWMPIFSQ